MKNKYKIINYLVYTFATIMMVISFVLVGFDSYNQIAFYITKLIGIIMFILSFLLLSIEYKDSKNN